MAIKQYSSLDLSNHPLLNQVGEKLSSAPISPVQGREYFDTVLLSKYIWNGTAWIPTDASKLVNAIPNSSLITNPLARANHSSTQLSNTISDLSTVVKGYTLDSFAMPNANVNMNNYTLTNLNTNPSVTGQAIEYSYFNNQLQTGNISSISKTFFTSTSIVTGIIYDTREDSDGGAWRKRCYNTSWYNETIYGTYRGECSNESVCRAIPGATTNDFFHNTTDGLFYALNVTSGVTQIYRGNRGDFPEVVAITCEALRVIIWDLTDAAVPMWKVLPSSTVALWFGGQRTLSCCSAVNGTVYLGVTGISDRGLCIANFTKDTGSTVGYYSGVNGNLGSILFWALPVYVTGAVGLLGSAMVNAIATTVLPTAPIDPTTGLPTPTIAVGTAGGLTVINNDGTVYNVVQTNTGYQNVNNVTITKDFRVIAAFDAPSVNRFYRSYALPLTASVTVIVNIKGSSLEYYNVGAGNDIYSAFLNGIGSSAKGAAAASGSNLCIGNNLGLTLWNRNPTTPGIGMLATINNIFNSGWLVGDNRGCWLADTVVESVNGTNLLASNPDGTFTTSTGWNLVYGATGAGISGGILDLTSSSVSNIVAGCSIPTVINDTYVVSWNQLAGSTSSNIYIGTTDGAHNVSTGNFTGVSGVTNGVFGFTATSTTSYINLVGGGALSHLIFDNISIIACSSDRSVIVNPLTVVGTLTKAVVNTSAQLVAYSGFSATNYLTQSYSSNLDFGTGDFCYMCWIDASSQGQVLFSRGNGVSAGSLFSFINGAGGTILFYIHNGTTWISFNSTTIPSIKGLYIVLRRSGVIEHWFNGVLITTIACTLTTTNTSAVLKIGNRQDAVQGNLTFASLFRVSATAPSADQIACIYETERKLFEVNAQCTLDGTSSTVIALNYDKITDMTHVCTAWWGRSAFRGLRRVESEVSPVGTVLAISSYDKNRITLGSTGAKYYSPFRYTRDELNRYSEQKRVIGRELITQNFTTTGAIIVGSISGNVLTITSTTSGTVATGQVISGGSITSNTIITSGSGTTWYVNISQTVSSLTITCSQYTFTLGIGCQPQKVFVNGVPKRLTTDYSITYDGFRYSVVFVSAPANGIWVSVQYLNVSI